MSFKKVILFLYMGILLTPVTLLAKTDYAKYCDTKAPTHLNGWVEKAAKEFKISPKVLATTLYKESGCNQKKVGSSGEIGLMQIHPKFWRKELNQAHINIYMSKDNIRAGAYILAKLSKRYKSAKDVVRSYNGSGAMALRYAQEHIKTYQKIWGKKYPKSILL